MTTTAAPLLPYLERLLNGETVEWKTLGEVARNSNVAKPLRKKRRKQEFIP